MLPVCLLATNLFFLRDALIGRMDMLALAFVLVALRLTLSSPLSGSGLTRRRLFSAGAASALATLTHPFGVAAPAAILADRAFCVADGDAKYLPC